MDKKRLILAIGLSSIIVIAWVIFGTFFNKPQQNNVNTVNEINSNQQNLTKSESLDNKLSANQQFLKIIPVEKENLVAVDRQFETEKFIIEYTSKGGLLKSIKLKKSPEINNMEVNMIISNGSGKYPFGLTIGDYNTDDVIYNVVQKAKEIEFSRDFKIVDGEKEFVFLLKKTFKFIEDEYLFNFKVTIESLKNEALPLDLNNIMYTLYFGPQIGPEFTKLDNTSEYRRYLYYSDGKRNDFSSKVVNNQKTIDKTALWIAIEGKYFIAIAYPPKPFLEPKTLGFNTIGDEHFKYVSSMFFERPYQRTSIIEDDFKFYIGPKKREILKKYSDMYFDKAVKDDIFLGWLTEILKYLLVFLQKGVKNWGVAIIIMTIIIKILLFPLTQKSSQSASKMQALAPKLNEIKEKYKDDQQKQQMEMAALYKKEGINPLGGCLPLLLQMPIFFALYGLLNNHFELRGAVFIPGWINDLSIPEKFLTLPFTIPILNTNELRLLPFIMVGTTFLQQFSTQNPNASTGQMKILMYAMPLIFFFIFYNMPSGLVVYWTVQNFLSVFQQIYINHVSKKGKKDTVGIIKKVDRLVRRKE